MEPMTLEALSEQLELADTLTSTRDKMFEPQDLPGRYGRVVRDVDRLLRATGSPAVLAGGWAVWRHGFVGRVTQDVDIVVPAESIEELLRAASVSGFEVLAQDGRWPKVLHKETRVKVDFLPEGQRPGSATNPAPTTIPHPTRMGGTRLRLQYVTLPGLIELKIAAGRARDEADVVELVRANQDQIDAVRRHLAGVHSDYARKFDYLVERASQQQDV